MPPKLSRLFRSWLIGATLVGASLVGASLAVSCSSESEAPRPPPPEPCVVTVDDAASEPLAEVAVHLDAPSSAQIDSLRADLSEYLGAMWQGPIEVAAGAPTGEGPTIWLSTSDEAATAVGAEPGQPGYRLQRQGDRVIAWGADEHQLAYATYALLEELGARFFHPREELVPPLGGPRLPRELDVERRPAFETRGIQLHLLHPIETLQAFTEPGADNLAEAKTFIDWLVKTGHNEVQWWIFADTDLTAYRPHAEAIIAYARDRGVRCGIIVQLFAGSSLQNGLALVQDEASWQTDISDGLDAVLAMPFDLVELALGEFLSADPQGLIDWLNHATAHIHDNHPGVEVSVVNHVGNYDSLWVDYQGQETFFYHLPGYADPRLINNVHTVFFFDLYRDWGGYAHDDFTLHHTFLLDQLGERTMRYLPESAYWVSADVDVPVFLPTYLYSRWLDIQGLHRDPAQAGLPPVEGHVMFSSGHEWGYWMTDYLAAKMMWEPDAPFERFTAHVTQAFGSCAPAIDEALTALIDLQTELLFDRRLAGYLSGEDLHDDLGHITGFDTTPRRVAFEDVHAMSDGDLAAFEQDVLAGLQALVEGMAPIEEAFTRACAQPDDTLASWCAELVDGTEVTRLRAAQMAALYRAVIAARAGQSAQSHLDAARAHLERARTVVERRSQHYRYDRDRLVTEYDNPTIYDYGYLHQAQELCYWERAQMQAELLVEEGVAANVAVLPSCVD